VKLLISCEQSWLGTLVDSLSKGEASCGSRHSVSPVLVLLSDAKVPRPVSVWSVAVKSDVDALVVDVASVSSSESWSAESWIDDEDVIDEVASLLTSPAVGIDSAVSKSPTVVSSPLGFFSPLQEMPIMALRNRVILREDMAVFLFWERSRLLIDRRRLDLINRQEAEAACRRGRPRCARGP